MELKKAVIIATISDVEEIRHLAAKRLLHTPCRRFEERAQVLTFFLFMESTLPRKKSRRVLFILLQAYARFARFAKGHETLQILRRGIRTIESLCDSDLSDLSYAAQISHWEILHAMARL